MSRAKWREQVVEAALEPELPIIDAHHHVWEKEPFPPFDPYTETDLLADKSTSGHNIVGTVFVDSHTSYRNSGPENLRVVGETEYANRVADAALAIGGKAAGACAAICPRADLTLGAAVADTLDAHAAASHRFRGIRHMTAYDVDVPLSLATGEGVMTERSFREGFAELGRRGLSFEAWLLQAQLPEVVDLACEFPSTTIVLNHLGGPMAIGRFAADRTAAFQRWQADMRTLAKCANVRVKIGGLNMGLAGVDALGKEMPFTSAEMVEAQRDYILTAIDLFGPTRCMFESNVPVDTHAAGYGIIWNAFKRISSGFSAHERARLFFGTAAETYRINPRDLER